MPRYRYYALVLSKADHWEILVHGETEETIDDAARKLYRDGVDTLRFTFASRHTFDRWQETLESFDE